MRTESALLLTLAFVALNAALVGFMIARRLVIEPMLRARDRWHSLYAKTIDRLIARNEEPTAEDLSALTPANRWQRQALEDVFTERASLLRGVTQQRLTRVVERVGVVDARMADLGSRRVWKRRIAAEVLGNARSERSVHVLLLALRDPDEDVRTLAAAALGKIGATSALPYIASLFRDLEEQRCVSVADTIVSFGERERVTRAERIDPLAALLDDSCEKVRYWATRCLGSLAKVPACLESRITAERLIARLADDSARVRAEACRAVGSLGICDEAPALAHALEDPDADVRRHAVSALGALMDPRTAEWLVLALEDRDFEVSSKAARALVCLGEPGIDAAQRFATAGEGAGLRRAIEVLNIAGRVSPL